MREYSPLERRPLPAGARLAAPPPPGMVTLDDPASRVMTDLREVPAATTTGDELVDRAHAFMIRRGVRLLFVTGADGAVEGVLTASDLLGEKPMRFMQARGLPHHELRVSDLMTPASQLDAVDLQDASQMRVGHVVATFGAVRRAHVVVASRGEVVGLFSASQVARQLGVAVQPFEVASTFADIEAALAGT